MPSSVWLDLPIKIYQSINQSINQSVFLSALVKFVPLSVLICSGHPRMLMHLLSAFAMESVSMECAIQCGQRVTLDR